MKKLLLLVAFLALGIAIVPHDANALPATGNGPAQCNSGTGENNNRSGVVCASPAPTAAPATIMTSDMEHIYAQSTTSCGGGIVPDFQAAQDLFVALQFCNGDSSQNTLIADCPVGSNCRTIRYVNPDQDLCSTSLETSKYATLNSAPGPNDEAFVHSTAPPSTSNRLTKTGGSCNTTGGSGGTLQIFPREDSSEAISWINANYGTWPSIGTWHGIFYDNQSTAYPFGFTNEYPPGWGIASWRTAIATMLNGQLWEWMTNSEGPGAGNYANVQTTTNCCTSNQAGQVYWAIDDEDVCDNLSTQARGFGFAMMFEKILGNTTSVSGYTSPFSGTSTSDFIYGHNTKIAINTASHHWHDANCATINLAISGMTGMSNSTSLVQRLYAKFLMGAMQPDNYDCHVGTPGVMMAARFSSNIQTVGKIPYYPENEICMGNRVQSIRTWTFDTSLGTGVAHGNGCAEGTTSGGTVDVMVQSLCGSIGVDGDGQTTGVYKVEFTNCYKLSVSIGHCMLVFNPSTTTDITESQLGATYTYSKIVTPTGRELADDPVTPGAGHSLCTTQCSTADGVYATTAADGTTTIPHCTYVPGVTDPKQNKIDVMITGQNCVRFFIQ